MEPNELFWFNNVESRTHPWPGLIWITPMLQVPNVKKARDLYIKTFGFVSIFDFPDDKDPNELQMTRLRYRGTNLVIVKEGNDYEGQAPSTSGNAPPITFYVYVDNLQETYEQALKNGMTSLQKPEETFWGDARARLQDPFGYIFDIATRNV